MPQIEIKHLQSSYHNKKGDTLALRDVSFLLPNRSFSVLVGYSGSGKTTLLKCLAGLLPYDGDIFWDGDNIEDMNANDLNIAFVRQEYALYPHLNVFDNIAYPLSVNDAPREEIENKVNSIAEEFGLTPCLARKIKNLSGGQQQRVALAKALIRAPDFLLLDEPLSNTDEPRRESERLFIKKEAGKYGQTVLYVTHDFKEALALGEKIFVIDNGEIVDRGSPKEIFDSFNPVTSSLRKASGL